MSRNIPRSPLLTEITPPLHKCQPWKHLWFAETLTANIISQWLGCGRGRYANRRHWCQSHSHPDLLPRMICSGITMTPLRLSFFFFFASEKRHLHRQTRRKKTQLVIRTITTLPFVLSPLLNKSQFFWEYARSCANADVKYVSLVHVGLAPWLRVADVAWINYFINSLICWAVRRSIHRKITQIRSGWAFQRQNKLFDPTHSPESISFDVRHVTLL